MIRIPGFLVSAVASGVKTGRKKDLALFYSEVPAKTAGVFTTNQVKAAPVVLGMERLKEGFCQAVVINSGNANACTGELGMRDAISTSKLVAGELGIDESLVIPSSTGLIGVLLPMEKIEKAIPELVSGLSEEGFEKAAEAIMTTDQFPKYGFRKVEIDGKEGTICAIGKGAGMIAPHMATMLCFVLTDIDIEPETLKKALKSASDNSFNRIIVDGDMSTNDTALILSSGKLGNEPIKYGDKNFELFQKSLNDLCTEIAEMIVRDGEGATKVVKIVVKGTNSEKDAEKIARTIGSSLLVKTAFYGEDANWGRVLAAAGRAGVRFDPGKVALFFGEYKIVENGIEVMDEEEVNHVLKSPKFTITLDLKNGDESSFVLASDITMDYLKINSHYRT